MPLQSELRPSLDAYRLADIAALEEIQHERGNNTLKQSWLNVANQLHTEGIQKNKISTIGKQIIIEKKREHLKKLNISDEGLKNISISGWWGEIMSEHGYTDQKHNTTMVTVPSPQNSSINTSNPEMVDLLYEFKDICNLAISKVKTMDSFENVFGKKEMSEFYAQTKAIITNWKDALDDKTKVPEHVELPFIQLLLAAETGLNNTVKLFFERRLKLLVDQGKKLLSSKQASKFLKGDKASTLPLLRHFDRETAIFGDCFGVQCKCGSWMVRSKSGDNNVECFDCGSQFVGNTISKCPRCQDLLLVPQIKHIIETHKCIICDKEIDLPQSVIDSVTQR